MDDSGVGGWFSGVEREVMEPADGFVIQRVEGQLRQAARLEALGELSGAIAHDFNNLLSIILGYWSLVAEELPPQSHAREDFEQIRVAALRGAKLARQLLTFGRREPGAPDAVASIPEVVGGVQALFERLLPRAIDLQVRLAHHLPLVFVDPAALEQVVMNLVVNARDAMPDGGTLTIEAERVVVEDGARRRWHRLMPGGYVGLSVEDTGTGMSEDVIQRIFEPYFTTKPAGKGTGLGLSTVHGLVTQAGGGITVDSVPGRGTRFVVLLPEARGLGEPLDDGR